MGNYRYWIEENRLATKTASWFLAGFLVFFCALTVQLSAKEGSSSRHQRQKRTTNAEVSRKRPVDVAPSSQHYSADFLAVTARDTVVVDPYAFKQLAGSNPPNSHLEPGSPAGVTGTFPFAVLPGPISQTEPLHDTTTVMTTDMLSLSTGTQSEVVRFYGLHQSGRENHLPSDVQAMPTSNYFGVSPNDCCDEWSGFCDCQQKMFGRPCKKCQLR